MRLINKKTKANTTISNPHKGLHPFIRKVVCVFFIPLGNLVSRVSKIKNHTCITWQDKRENKIKPNQNYKDSQKNGKYVSSNDAFMFVLVFMSLRVSSCIRVFVYSCIRVFVYLRTNEGAIMTKSSTYMRNTSYSKFFEVLTQKTRMFSSDEFQVILN